ncbi:MAG: autotransporter-associated beta strand repeat-containing protein, partial [Candidatus Omnitrophica bacterium]|nr:autotransporter-associated beta strand repeat-containing protein [Candidatus Omnitrophota bacterium]
MRNHIPKSKFHGGILAKALLLSLFVFLLSTPAFAEIAFQGNPDGITVTQDGSVQTITVNNPVVYAEATATSAAASETVKFVPAESLGGTPYNICVKDISGVPTQFNGTLMIVGGTVFLVNPSGITFGATAQVNVSGNMAGFIASTLNISKEAFEAGVKTGNFDFQGVGACIVNQGTLVAANPGSFICLLSNTILNTGKIEANLGTIVLAAGEQMTLSLDPVGTISVAIDKAVESQVLGADAIRNTGEIKANGGKIIIDAKVLNGVFDHAINNSGIIQATKLEEHNGVVELKAEGAPIVNTNKIEATTVDIDVRDSSLLAFPVIPSMPVSELLSNIGPVIVLTSGIQSTGDLPAESGSDSSTSGDSSNSSDASQAATPVTPIIIAKDLTIKALHIGTPEHPVQINAEHINISRTAGGIDILESLLSGDNVLMRGPPEGFGAFIYNRDAYLTLDAEKISLLGSEPTYLYGNITFSDFECTIPGKEIYFEAGKTYTILGTFKIQGAYARHVKLLSSEQGKQWFIDPQGSRDLSYTWVEDSYNLSLLEILIVEGTNRGNCFNWDPTATWTGAVSALWSDAGNWDGLGGGVAPGAGDALVFPDGASNLTNSNDLTDGITFNSLTFTGSGYTLDGNSIILAAGLTDDSTAGLNTINLAITFNTTQTVTVTDSGTTLTLNGIISGAGGLTKAGAGQLTLAGANSYSGGTTLNAGTLNINNASAIGTGTFTIAGGTINNTSGGLITLSTDNVQNWNGNFTFAGANDLDLGIGPVTLGANRTVTISGSNLTVGGIIGGAFRLTKAGAGQLTLTGANTFSGGMTLNAGTLNINNASAIGTGTFTIAGGTINNTSGGLITLSTDNVQ